MRYLKIPTYHDTVLLCGETAILHPSMVHIFGVGLSEYVTIDPDGTGKYKELHGYHYGEDGKQVTRIAVIPSNIIEFKPTLTILLSIDNLPFRKFHNLKCNTELLVNDDCLDDNYWNELTGLLDYGGAENITYPIKDDTLPALVKNGSDIKLELYNLGVYYSGRDLINNRTKAMSKSDIVVGDDIPWHVMSYRAECQGDVFKVTHTLEQKDFCYRITKFLPDPKLGEVLIEMEYWGCGYHDILEVLKDQEDSYIMYETCRPVKISQNSMKRKSLHDNAQEPVESVRGLLDFYPIT